MKPKLPRALLWSDKKTMDDFLKESINVELYNYYNYIRRGTHASFSRDSSLILFNEIYYQVTKINYEKKFLVSFKELTQDIKANVGSLQNGLYVLNMMYVFLYLIDKKSKTLSLFTNRLRGYLMKVWNLEDSIEYVKRLGRSYTTDIHPKPSEVKELNGLVLDWKEITNDYNKQSIEEVVNLWPSKEDKFAVLNMIEFHYLRTRKNTATLKKYRSDDPELADPVFFIDMYSKFGFKVENKIYPVEESANDRPTYEELEEENYNLKKKNAILESENERLRSERNPLRQKKNRERAFSLGMIVDYCKKHLNIERSNVIVGMLNKFLRDAKDYTQAECDLVDSIEIEYLSKKFGDTIMGDKNDFYGNSGLNQIALPPGMTPQEAIKLLQSKETKNNGKERKG